MINKIFCLLMLLLFYSCDEILDEKQPEVEIEFQDWSTEDHEILLAENLDIKYVDISNYLTSYIESYTDQIRLTVLTTMSEMDGSLIVFIYSNDEEENHSYSVIEDSVEFGAYYSQAKWVRGTVLPLIISDDSINHENINIDLEIRTDSVLDTISFMSKTNSLELMPMYSFGCDVLHPDTSSQFFSTHVQFNHENLSPAFVVKFNINDYGYENAFPLNNNVSTSIMINSQQLCSYPFSTTIIKFE